MQNSRVKDLVLVCFSKHEAYSLVSYYDICQSKQDRLSMSRLIVKNLPPKTSEEKFRQSFSAHGLITDVQLKYTKDGKFRNFAFIGYKSEEDAQRAQKFFNNSYFGAAKIQVDFCANLGDAESKPRAWSKYAKDSSAYKKMHQDDEDSPKEKSEKAKRKEKKKLKAQKQIEVDALMAKYKDDTKFQEFLRVQRRSSSETWNNDAILAVGKQYTDEQDQVDNQEDSEDEEGRNADDKKLSDLDYLKSKGLKKMEIKDDVPKEKKIFFTVKLENLPCTVKKKDVKQFFGPNVGIKSIRVPRNIKGIAYVGFGTEQQRKAALKKDKSFIGKTQVHVRTYDVDQKQAEISARESKWKQQEETLANLDETIGQSGRLFIRNLSYSVTEDDIESLFKAYGPLAEVNVPIDKMTKQVKGFAFVTFVIPENAVQAFTKLDGTVFQGRLLHIIAAKPPTEENADENAGANSSYKQKKSEKQKKQAQSSHNWNTLFLGASAVADMMSDKYQVSKQDVLLSSGDTSAAVRLALGETQIVEDTRKFLESEGVRLEAFEGVPKKRSKTVIIVKNLPAMTAIEAIRNKFAAHGQLQRVVMPPSCPTCLVEFTEPSEARVAFKSLAYINFNGNPLYLEWAPEDAFAKAAEMSQNIARAAKDTPKVEESLPDTAAEENATLFVKNLNFNTVDSSLREMFENTLGKGVIHSISIATKRDPKNPGGLLSMGYGFVQFKKASTANEALKTLQHKMLDNHSIELKRSNRVSTANETVQTARKVVQDVGKISSKMVVRNVPFEATQKEVQAIFATFGTLKSVRLPKKMTGSHRGFAFVEFNSKEEAKKAFDKLCHSTHLYGRRLVLEWANEEETLEELRKRTSSHIDASGEPSKKKVKKSTFIESVEAAV